MQERNDIITFQGNPLTLLGEQVKVGQPAPAFKALTTDLGEFDFASTKGKIVIISSVPSLDTPVCDIQARRFNEEVGKLGDGVVLLAISMDLPFALGRWCGAAGIERLITLSDHRDAAFGQAYGELIKELRLLARTVIVIDRDGKVAYIEQVPELTNEPDYAAAMAAVKKLM